MGTQRTLTVDFLCRYITIGKRVEGGGWRVEGEEGGREQGGVEEVRVEKGIDYNVHDSSSTII